MENKREKTIEEVEEIQEISTMGGGGVQFGPATTVKDDEEESKEKNEDKIRSVIREAIKLYSIRKENLRAQSVFEDKLRETIRKIIISEAKASKEPPPSSTLEGFLRTFLKNKLPSVKIEFNKLQDSNEEKYGFIETFMFGVSDLFKIPGVAEQPEEEELNEEEEDKKVKMRFGAFDDLGLDGEEQEQEEPEEPEEEDPMDKGAQTDFDVGSRTGYTAVQELTSAIQDLKKNIVPQNLENARSTLLRNFAGWIDQWTIDNDEITDFLSKTLQKLDVEVPDILRQQQPEQQPEQPVMEEDFLEEEIDFD